MKSTIRLISRILRRRKRKSLQIDKQLCYSYGGFLTDLLEQNGFMIDALKRYGNSYHIEIRLSVDEELFKARLKKIAKTHVIKF